ncbi:hypothetical protein [Mycoplasmopsis bovis]|uniref:hypothetical protein n=1 Tax=Mycoplasmopsis bovis TaxID=28903 RepID=UPI0024BBC258|nr:hypothetical protein [Mycoplasmopsis bovis]WHO14961.1 hypothetical protein HYD92_05040 [Mycoplasmopsis bovis]
MWVKFNDWYNQVVEVPKIFGLNHILFICAAIALTIFLLFVFQSASRNVVRGAIIFVWIFIFLSELILGNLVKLLEWKFMKQQNII